MNYHDGLMGIRISRYNELIAAEQQQDALITALQPFAAKYARIMREGDKPLKVLVPFDWLRVAAETMGQMVEE